MPRCPASSEWINVLRTGFSSPSAHFYLRTSQFVIPKPRPDAVGLTGVGIYRYKRRCEQDCHSSQFVPLGGSQWRVV